ncbi:hypothetical protein AVEN_188645-1 [Araneus ventricosus]|uniref:Uncharacterized protein n=1 Tax=Araneus ventricosus TaxID=182803 RepID=A0A4Y2RZA8_ARAVE|nr:hypothetical protein AVEN_188645-1 [Araneus ventricosus]
MKVLPIFTVTAERRFHVQKVRPISPVTKAERVYSHTKFDRLSLTSGRRFHTEVRQTVTVTEPESRFCRRESSGIDCRWTLETQESSTTVTVRKGNERFHREKFTDCLVTVTSGRRFFQKKADHYHLYCRRKRFHTRKFDPTHQTGRAERRFHTKKTKSDCHL